MIIAVDFDGTLVEHDYPEIGMPVPFAVNTLRELIMEGHKIILHTMRSGNTLADAAAYCTRNGIELFSINANPEQASWTASPKVYAHAYIDDAAIGCPLIRPSEGRPYVDWYRIHQFLFERGFLKRQHEPHMSVIPPTAYKAAEAKP